MIYTQGELDLYLYCSRCNIHHMLLVAVGKKCSKTLFTVFCFKDIYFIFADICGFFLVIFFVWAFIKPKSAKFLLMIFCSIL